MEKLSMCRICLVEDVRLRSIVETHLQEMYESLVLIPFETKDRRPILVCYICCARLQNCYELRRSCIRSEELFTQMLTCDELEPMQLQETDNKKRLTMHHVVHFSVGHELQTGADNVGVEALMCDDVKVEQSVPEDINEDALQGNSVYDNIQYNVSYDDALNILKKKQAGDRTSKPKIGQRQVPINLADEIVRFQPPKIRAPIAASGHYPARNGKKKARCKWCAMKKVDTCTVWMCDTCNVNLCILGCFKNYHTSVW